MQPFSPEFIDHLLENSPLQSLELMGAFTALLVLGQTRYASDLLQAPEGEDVAHWHAILEDWNVQLSEALRDESFQFSLNLPERDDLREHAEDLVDWARGFLIGVSFVHEQGCELPQDDDSQEFLRDLEAFLRLDMDSVEADDEGELDLLTLEEHLRTGCMLLFAQHALLQQDDEEA